MVLAKESSLDIVGSRIQSAASSWLTKKKTKEFNNDYGHGERIVNLFLA